MESNVHHIILRYSELVNSTSSKKRRLIYWFRKYLYISLDRCSMLQAIPEPLRILLHHRRQLDPPVNANAKQLPLAVSNFEIEYGCLVFIETWIAEDPYKKRKTRKTTWRLHKSSWRPSVSTFASPTSKGPRINHTKITDPVVLLVCFTNNFGASSSGSSQSPGGGPSGHGTASSSASWEVVKFVSNDSTHYSLHVYVLCMYYIYVYSVVIANRWWWITPTEFKIQGQKT